MLKTFFSSRVTDFKSAPAPLRGRLTERLLAQGLLTPNMLQELKKEWDRSSQSNRPTTDDEDDDDPSPYKKFRRKRTKKS